MFESDQIDVSFDKKEAGSAPLREEYLASSSASESEIADKPAPLQKSSSCAGSVVYRKIIGGALARMYDPGALGETNEVMNRYNCEIQAGESPIEMADKTLASDDDPFTDLLTEEEMEKHNASRRGDYKGIGATLATLLKPGTENEIGSVVISKLASDSSPAKLAGLKRGDIVTNIDGQSTEGKHAGEVVSMIRAASDMKVSVGVIRDGESLEFYMGKERIEYPAVRDRHLPDKNLAFISIDTFHKDSSAAELYRALRKYPDVDGFILDLRGNMGGQSRNFIASASMFVDEGVLQKVVSRKPGSPDAPQYYVSERSLTDNQILTTYYDKNLVKQIGNPKVSSRIPDIVDKPVVILTNGATYSAAEAFAAALRDNGDAIIVGTKTGGKGIGQLTMPIEGVGALKITTFKALTPKGRWLGDAVNNRFGLEPDIEVEMDQSVLSGSARDPQLNAAIEFLGKK